MVALEALKTSVANLQHELSHIQGMIAHTSMIISVNDVRIAENN